MYLVRHIVSQVPIVFIITLLMQVPYQHQVILLQSFTKKTHDHRSHPTFFLFLKPALLCYTSKLIILYI